MPGYLPDPPQIPVAGMGAHPSPQVNNSPSWNNPAAIAQGIGNFAQNYMLAQKEKKQEAWQRFQTTINLANMGVPIDDKQLVKDIKFLKLPIALDPEEARTFTAPQAQGPQSSTAPPLPQAEAMMLAGGQMPVGGAVAQPTMPGVQGPPPQPAQLPPGGMGGALPIAPPMQQPQLSPEVQAAAARPGPDYMQSRPVPKTLSGFLSSLQQQGWDEKQMRSSMQNILKGALQGDNRALEMATRLGLTKTIGAHDELFLLADKLFPDKTPMEAQAAVGKMLLYDIMGGPQMEAKKMDVAKGMLPFFDNQLDKAREYVEAVYNGKQPAEQPKMSFDQMKDIVNMQGNFTEQFPTAGPISGIYATLLAAGKTKEAMQLVSGVAEHYPSKAQIGMWEKDRAFNWDKTKFGEAQKLDYARMAQAKQQFDQQYALNTLQFYQQKATSNFNKWWDIFRNEKSTAAEKEDAIHGLADELIKNGVDVTVDKVRTFWHPFSGEPRIKIKDRGKESVGTTMGAMKPLKNPFGEEDGNYWNQLSSYMSKLPGFTFDFFRKAVTGAEE